MGNDASAVKVGILVLTSLIVVLVMIGLMTGGLLVTHPTRLAEFPLHEGVSGLRPGSEVRVGGVRVGRVRDVEAVAADGRPRVRVSFELPETFVLREGARVVVDSGLAGDAWLNVTDLGDGDPLPPDRPVRGTSRGLTAVADRMGDLQEEVSRVLARVEEETLPAIESSFVAIQEATEAVGAASSSIGAMVDENRDALRTALRSAGALTEVLETQVPPTLDRLDEMLEGGHEALVAVRQTFATLDPAIVEATELVRGVRDTWIGQQGRIDGILGSLGRAGQDLELAVGEIRRSPWRLLHRPAEPLEEHQPLYDAARAFARAAGDLRSATVALEAAAGEPGIDEARLEPLLETLQESAEQFETVQRAFFEQLQEATGSGSPANRDRAASD